MKNYHKCKVKATLEKYSIKVITRINPLGNTEVRWFCKKKMTKTRNRSKYISEDKLVVRFPLTPISQDKFTL